MFLKVNVLRDHQLLTNAILRDLPGSQMEDDQLVVGCAVQSLKSSLTYFPILFKHFLISSRKRFFLSSGVAANSNTRFVPLPISMSLLSNQFCGLSQSMATCPAPWNSENFLSRKNFTVPRPETYHILCWYRCLDGFMLSVCDWLIVDHVSLSWNLFLDNHSDEVQTFTCTHNVYIVYVVVQSQVVVLMIGG